MVDPLQRIRTVREVIDQAIRENRPNEYLLYAFATLLFLAGLALLVASAFWEKWIPCVAGTLAQALCLPPMLLAKRIRKENMSIRLLEAALTKAETADDALRAIAANFTLAHQEEKAPLPKIRKAVKA